jgi:hypothetical protein
LASLQERLRNTEEDVYGCGPIFGLDITGCDDAGLLLSFIELSFFDSSTSQNGYVRVRGSYFVCRRTMIFSIFALILMILLK